MDAVSYAIGFTNRGYSCYPVNVEIDSDGNKIPSFKPTIRDGKFYGWKNGDYPKDSQGIRKHWEGYDGIAINTGRSRIVVVDIDKSNGKDGQLSLRAAGISLPDTPLVVRTQSGGEHRYYRMGSIDVPCSQGELSPGVDIRGVGGVVFAPPTVVHGAGSSYSFAPGASAVPVELLPEFPPYLAARLADRGKTSRPRGSTPQRPLTPDERAFHEQRIGDALKAISQLEGGRRHAGLLKYAPIVFGSALLFDRSPEEYIERIKDAYEASGGTDWRHEERTVRDSLDYAREHPYELRDIGSDTEDEDFEREVDNEVRRRLIRQAADAKLSPIKERRISDDDLLVFDPETGDGDWWIPGVLPKGETVILFGKPTAGKTFAALDLLMGVATGTRAWGMKVEQGNALYLAGEGTRRLPARQRAWIEHNKIVPQQETVQLRRMSLTLASDRSVMEHAEFIAQHEIDLVVIDTMIRAAEGLVLENTSEAAKIIQQLDNLRSLRSECTVVALHHPPESEPDKPGGAYPIRGNVDTILQLSAEHGIRTLKTTKSKEGDDSWSAKFRLQDVQIPGGTKSAVFVPEVGYQSPFWNTPNHNFLDRAAVEGWEI